MATTIKTGGSVQIRRFGVRRRQRQHPVTDTDPATYRSSDETVATVTNDADDPQDGTITLTGKVTDPEQAVEIVASFPAQRGGQPFEVKGTLIVIEPAAAGATASITGPGIVPDA